MTGQFKKQLSLMDLTFIGLGAIFGSGWLFSASHVAAQAGPAGIISWLIGGFAVLILGIVYCELGAALPRAGGIIRYPVFSHGPLQGYLLGSITVIAFSSLIAIEVVAAREYAAAWFPSLTVISDGVRSPSTRGWLFQFALLCFFFALNYYSIKTFAVANNLISILKFAVPILVIVALLYHFKPANFTATEFAPMGARGVEGAVSAGGIIFAYLGLTPIISVASEVKRPQFTIPFALILSIVLATVIYVTLQIAFLGAVPTDMLANGWQGINEHFPLPYRDIAMILGLGWLALFVVSDAIISPSGCGNIYMAATPRVIYAWSNSNTFFKIFSRVHQKSGIPRYALWLTFALSIFWTLPFPSWEKMITVVSAALVLSYAIAPVTVGALRRNAPDLERPFYVKGFAVLGPLSFTIASFILYWSGWNVISWLLGSQIILFILYIVFSRFVPTHEVSLAQQIKSSAWLITYYLLIILASYLGTFGEGASHLITEPFDNIVVMIIALICYYWGTHTGLPKALIKNDDEA
ncbi:aspartate/glutamate:proton symporter (AGT family) [Acinetobacter calcoaceticus]|uniref:Aspartate/glutamate:proton symporter (AGT family) n=1 Tax=Acinetobacter calcoaceticus TaxID=471 RepID=A0A4R1XIV7_ACICA|nr:aspartate/glutamate:proton symporter (AGT family) [Acinetobacter calcoaceticus]